MAKMSPYHSALKAGKLQEADPFTGRYEDDRGNHVLHWNILDRPIPAPFYECDVIYTEPAWPAGLRIFDERAGTKTPSYAEYALAMGELIEEFMVPTVMIVGKAALKGLPEPDMITEIDMNGNPVNAVFWNGAAVLGATNKEIIRNLAKEYNAVGDFCCGYGTTGVIFAEEGKRFVLSDYNATCVGYVRSHMDGWGRG